MFEAGKLFSSLNKFYSSESGIYLIKMFDIFIYF